MKIKTYDNEGKLVRVKRFPSTVTIREYQMFVLDHYRHHPNGSVEIVEFKEAVK